jgi:hypothetical protein
MLITWSSSEWIHEMNLPRGAVVPWIVDIMG